MANRQLQIPEENFEEIEAAELEANEEWADELWQILVKLAVDAMQKGKES